MPYSRTLKVTFSSSFSLGKSGTQSYIVRVSLAQGQSLSSRRPRVGETGEKANLIWTIWEEELEELTRRIIAETTGTSSRSKGLGERAQFQRGIGKTAHLVSLITRVRQRLHRRRNKRRQISFKGQSKPIAKMDDGADDYFTEDLMREEEKTQSPYSSQSSSLGDYEEAFFPPPPPLFPPNDALVKNKNEIHQLDAMIDSRRRYGRCNSTSTVKVDTTMAHPNHDATIEVIARRLHDMMVTCEEANTGILRIDRHAASVNSKNNSGSNRNITDPSRRFGSVDLSCFNDPNYKVLNSSYWSDSDSDDDYEALEEFVAYHEVEEEKDENNFYNEFVTAPACNENRSCGTNTAHGSLLVPARTRGVLTEHSPRNSKNGPSSYRKGGFQEPRKNTRISQQHHLPNIPKPSTSTIREHVRNMFVTAQCSEECNIICLLYVERLLECADNVLAFNPYNWKAIVMMALLLASKVWDDLSMVNEDFSIFMPYSLEQINRWESQYLTSIQFNVRVSASQYAQLYFELRKQAQLAGFEGLPQKELDVAKATKLEALTTTMEKRTKQINHVYVASESPGALSSPNGPGNVMLTPIPGTDVQAEQRMAQRHLRRVNSDAGPHRSACRFVID